MLRWLHYAKIGFKIQNRVRAFHRCPRSHWISLTGTLCASLEDRSAYLQSVASRSASQAFLLLTQVALHSTIGRCAQMSRNSSRLGISTTINGLLSIWRQRCSRMAWSPVCARLSLSTLPLQRTTTKTLTRSSNTRDTPRSPLLFTPPPQFSSAFDTSRCVKSTATARLGAPPPLPSPSAKAGYAYAGPLYGSCISTRPMRLTVPSLNSSMLPARCLAPEETLSACAHVWLDESVYVLCRSFPERALVHIS
jgi:hypothetical protein